MPQNLLAELAETGRCGRAGCAARFIDWAEDAFDLSLRGATAEWSDEELYLSAPGPGRDAWVSIDRASGAAKFETTDRGWVAYFNDLHKGRNTGIAWTIFIDVVAVAVLFFSLTGPGAAVDPGGPAHVHLAAGRRRHRHRGRAHDLLRTLNS